MEISTDRVRSGTTMQTETAGPDLVANFIVVNGLFTIIIYCTCGETVFFFDSLKKQPQIDAVMLVLFATQG